MLSKHQRELFDNYYDSAFKNEILDPKLTVMLHLASAMAVGCYA